jgi:hypothetical protein
VIFVGVSSAGDHDDVKVRQVKSGRPIALPVGAIRAAALFAWSRAVVMWPRLAGVLFTGPSSVAGAGHGTIVAGVTERN